MANQAGPSHYNFGLLGWPLGHSLSPNIHAAALKACHLSGSYALYPAPPLPAGAQELESLFQRLRRADLHGLNVTIPHKQSVIPNLDRLTDLAEKVGAVNLIYLEDGSLVGDNCDVPAFWIDLQRATGLTGRAGTALVLGAGGAARAAVYALLQANWGVHIASRRVESARRLVLDLAPQPAGRQKSLTALPLEAAALRTLPDCDLVVNATPVGMSPHIQETPWPADVPFPPHAAFYDMVYNPAETVLVKAARSAGLTAANGLGMLVEQAALSFERWTSLTAARSILWEVAVAALIRTETPGTV